MAVEKKEGKFYICEDERTRITVDNKFCKSCVICVEFCPADVLIMKDNKPRVAKLEACTRCMLCEVRCPDFAIWVEKLDAKKETPK